ncbi:hypothetical protein [Streptomyces sp. NPDC052036]|uniref:hypothetical protein n=1 Tax=unclassified Streptomyces TaxID=2593676 RepID=UPI00341E0049
MDELREEADRIQAELAAAELEWQEWVIARRRVDGVAVSSAAKTTDIADLGRCRSDSQNSAVADDGISSPLHAVS